MIKKILSILLIVSMTLLVTSRIRSQSTIREEIFRVGERFIYDLSFWGIKAGTQTIEVLSRDTIEGHPVYCILSQSRSIGPARLLYKLNDVLESYFDVQQSSTRRLIENIQEGEDQSNSITNLDLENHKATIREDQDIKVIDIPPRVVDNVSLIYYLRALDLKVGDSFPINIISRRGLKEGRGSVVKKKRVVKSRWGVRSVLVVEDEAKKIQVWFSDDSRKIPVRIEVATDAGRLIGSLKSIEYDARPAR